MFYVVVSPFHDLSAQLLDCLRWFAYPMVVETISDDPRHREGGGGSYGLYDLISHGHPKSDLPAIHWWPAASRRKSDAYPLVIGDFLDKGLYIIAHYIHHYSSLSVPCLVLVAEPCNTIRCVVIPW